ncbi:MAG: hypothetical protein H0X30_21500 [Anaerolineae bacterium]|nr:hypothetical protein [Anaerolineae bacterium]
MIKKLCITLLLCLISSVVLAQNKVPKLTETFTDPISGLTVKYPSDWSAAPSGESSVGGLKLSNHEFSGAGQQAVQPGEMDIEVVPPKQLDGLVGGAAFEEAWSAITERLPGNPDEAVDVDQFASHGRYLTSQTEQYIITAGMVELKKGTYALFIATTHPDTVDEALPIYYAIGGSLSLTETVANTLFAKTQTFKNKAETAAFIYPADDKWTAYEKGGIAVATNAGSIAKFSAKKGQYLIVVSAVASDKADQTALFSALLPTQNFAIPLPPILINPDGSDNTSGEALGGLVGKQAGKDVAIATAIVGPQDALPQVSIGSDTQSTTQIATDQELVAIIRVFGPAGEEKSVSEMLDLVAHSLHVPVDLSSVKPSTVKLTEKGEEGPLSVQYPSGWDSFFRGGFNVVGTPKGAKGDIRLIMSGRKLDQGETVESALHKFVELFNYDTFDTMKLSDGRTVYIGAPFNLTEAVLEVNYGKGLVITMSYLPTNPEDFMVGLPDALAILESIKLNP